MGGGVDVASVKFRTSFYQLDGLNYYQTLLFIAVVLLLKTLKLGLFTVEGEFLRNVQDLFAPIFLE